jgi:hypothetical protein
VAVASSVGAVIFAVSPEGGPVDVVGRAEAALSPRGVLVHYAFTQRSGRAVGSGVDTRVASDSCPPRGRVEVWQATDPARWRASFPALPRGGRCGGKPIRRGEDDGSRTIAWAAGTRSEYSPSTKTQEITTGYAEHGAAAAIPTGIDTPRGSGEPIEELRTLLADDALRDAGVRTVDGRRLRSFTSTRTERLHDDAGRVSRFRELIVYQVDAETFEPVRSLRTFTIPTIRRTARKDGRLGTLRIRGGRTYADELDFTSYDRRPLDAEARALLVIHPATGTTTSRETRQERVRRMRRASPRAVVR